MSKFKTLFFSLLLFWVGILSAQNFVPNQIIIQLQPENEFEFNQKGILSRQILSKEWAIFLLEIDTQNTDLEAFIKNLKTDKNVVFAQKNHILQSRNSPNDSLYTADKIWQSDILGLETAWQYTTGGINALGDTIVVAVIDNGCDLTHPDLQTNLWKNHSEIANNQIDDDQNGFIDDVRGWTFPRQRDTIFPQAHGTSVSGLIGAVGNNQIGAVGINWRVKIMQLIANEANTSIVESNVIAAYSYVSTMRRLYQESNGTKGAYIVATNASFGIDNEKPEDFPVWCSIYDSLGALGILSVAATSNAEKDIDSAGDMPTACPSPFLIAAAAINQNNQLQGGFGRKSVDLCAPSGVFSTKPNQQYGTFSGTSAASPQIAAAIALLNAYPNQNWADFIKTQPQAANLLLKEIIFQTVDVLPNIQKFLHTGGRLQVGRAMQLLAQRYTAAPKTELLAIYPNPSSEGFWVKWALQEAIEAEINVFNLSGQRIFSQQFPPDWAKTEISFIDAKNWAAGAYLVQFKTAAYTHTQKWIKF